MEYSVNIFGAISPYKDERDPNSTFSITDLEVVTKEMTSDDTLLVYINSPGGEVFEGISIANKINEIADRVTIKILGRADSIASVILCAAKEVIAFNNTSALLHKPWTILMGNEDDLENSKAELAAVKQQMLATYLSKVNLTESELEDVLAQGKRHGAAQLKKWGFVDKIEKPAAKEKELINLSDTIYNSAVDYINSKKSDKKENNSNVSSNRKDSLMDPQEILNKLAEMLDKSATQDIKSEVAALSKDVGELISVKDKELQALASARDALAADISAKDALLAEQQAAIASAAATICKQEVSAFVTNAGIPEAQQSYVIADLSAKYADKQAFAEAQKFYSELYAAHKDLKKPLPVSNKSTADSLPADYFNASPDEKQRVAKELKALAEKNGTSFIVEYNKYISASSGGE